MRIDNLSNKELFDGINEWKRQMVKNGFLHLFYADTLIGDHCFAPTRLFDEIEKRIDGQQKQIDELTHENRVLAGDKRKSLETLLKVLGHFSPLSWLPASMLTEINNSRKTIEAKIKTHDDKHPDQIIEP